jgi:5-methylcytosine-specific restriction endonuclease McrA
MKKCSKCGEEKPLTEFYKGRSDCKECKKKAVKIYQETSPVRKAWLNSETGKQANRRKVAKYAKTEKGKAKIKAYQQSEKEKERCRLKTGKRRSIYNGRFFTNFSREDLSVFWVGQNILEDRCYYCGKPMPDGVEHIDHYIPLSQGGSHEPVNLRPSCACCNLKKGSKDPIQFQKEINYGNN